MRGEAISVKMTPSASISTREIPDFDRVYAIIVGLENYQDRGNTSLPHVEFARNDATGFAAALRSIYPPDKLMIEELSDNEATFGNISYILKQTIAGLGKNDLFVFYYAGHGFHGAGGNRITAWETHPHHVGETSLLLRDVLFERLLASSCMRALAFIDACASEFRDLVKGRDVISDLDTKELAEFLSPERYSAVFLSCEPGQKSYASSQHKHGIWTYFLLRALRGEADEALSRDRYLTDVTLRDYLAQEVPRFITRETEIKGRQRPQAIITSSNTFAIRQVPATAITIARAGDLSAIRLAPEREFLEAVDSKPIKTLWAFSKGRGHFIPDRVCNQATMFVRTLITEQIEQEMQRIYENVKSTLRLKRRDLTQKSGNGQGSLDADLFRFSIEARQNRSRPSEYVVLRRLDLREGALSLREQFDHAFGAMFERVVIEGNDLHLDFDELVDFFENIKDAHGGTLKEEKTRNRVTYVGNDGTRLGFDLLHQRVMLGGTGKEICSILLDRAQRYRFGLTHPSKFLAS
jgi:hypothetical protein